MSLSDSARHAVTLDDLGGQNFTGVPEAAAILGGCDPRTIRSEIRAGRIPAIRVGTKWMVPIAWLREQVLGGIQPTQPAVAAIDVEQLADRVADRLVARFAGIFSMMAPAIKIANAPGATGAQAGQDGATSYGQRNSAA
jgi:hypothetical protein